MSTHVDVASECSEDDSASHVVEVSRSAASSVTGHECTASMAIGQEAEGVTTTGHEYGGATAICQEGAGNTAAGHEA